MRLHQWGILAAGIVAAGAQAAVVVAPINLNTIEDGTTVQYQVVLDSPPDAGEIVTVTPSSWDVTEGTVSGAIAFNDANWDTPQYVTVTPGASGDGNDGDVMYSITNAITVTNPSAYTDGAGTDVNVTNQNIDGVTGITVSPSNGVGLFISESGPGTIVTIAATTFNPPDVSLTVNLAISDPTRVALSAPSVTLTAGNGFSQTVTVLPVDDDADDGDLPFTIVTSLPFAGDPDYLGIDPVDIQGVSVDDDTAAITVTPNSGITVTEGGVTQSVTIAASGATPTADVTVDVIPTAEVTVSTASVVLTAGNGYSASFDITAVDDALVDGDLPFTVTTDPAVSADSGFAGLDPSDVTGTAADNDAPPAPAGPAVSLPTMNHLGQFILMMLITGFGLRALRKRK